MKRKILNEHTCKNSSKTLAKLCNLWLLRTMQPECKFYYNPPLSFLSQQNGTQNTFIYLHSQRFKASV